MSASVFRWAAWGGLLAFASSVFGNANAPGLQGFDLPPGFSIVEYAGPDLVHDLQAMTIDGRGRVYVAHRGALTMLPDADGDGRADSAILIATFPKDGAMGLLVEKDWLYFTGDNMVGRTRLGADGRPTGKVESLLPVRTGGEHAAHALRRGPDGWLYLICGNEASLPAIAKLPNFAHKTSPVVEPVAGGVVRIAPDEKRVEIVCDGFRNAYDMDFGQDGRLYTFDSDNERCVSLPWYEGTRFYRVVPGGHYGWQNPQRAATWRMPPYWFDVVSPLADLGRGSPTGVTCYSGKSFPHRYRGGFFLSDWTFGTIRFAAVTGAKAVVEKFLASTGENGFAPSATFVHPQSGELYIAIGGRGTRGGVYRVGYRGDLGPTVTTSHAIPSENTVARRLELQDASPASMLQRGTTCILDENNLDRWLVGIRQLQLGLGQLQGSAKAKGTVFEGYSGWSGNRLAPAVEERLQQRFPTGDKAVDREIARLFAIAGAAPVEWMDKLTRQWTATSDPVDDIHWLIAFAAVAKRSTVADEQFSRAARALLELDRKLDARKSRRDRNWPLRIVETLKALSLADAAFYHRLVGDPAFGRFDHALFAKQPGFDRTRAAEIFLARLKAERSNPPTSDVLEVLTSLPATTVVPVIRDYWDELGLRSRLVALLAKSPDRIDLDRFLEGAGMNDVGTARQCVHALEKLGVPNEPARLALLLRALKLAETAAQPGDLPARIRSLLSQTTKQLDGKATAEQWLQWLALRYPAEFSITINAGDWRRRLGNVDWSKGNEHAGAVLFRKLACGNCHNGNKAVGPDLLGVAGRFSRDDLFAAVFEPNRDVGSRYRTTIFTTRSGQTHEGAVIYEAADGAIVQTGLDRTVRLAADEIESRRSTDRSLMPSGLLDRATDSDLANLYAYLRSLKK